MRIFKTRAFTRWAFKEGVSDTALSVAVAEMVDGLIDADLGGQVCKKRVAVSGRGKSKGVRTLIAFRVHDKAFFIYGFAKSARANVGTDELKALKLLARALLNHSDDDIARALQAKELIEIFPNVIYPA